MNNEIAEGQFYFTEENEWILLERDHAFGRATKKELSRVENVEIHTVGKALNENQVFGRIRTQRYLGKLIMPLRGKVVEANIIL